MDDLFGYKELITGGDMTDIFNSWRKRIEGDGPIEKHILLLKLKDILENSPDFGVRSNFDSSSPQRQWLSQVKALLSRLGFENKMKFESSFNSLPHSWKYAIIRIQGQVLDAIEEIKLDLELDDRSEIGSAYAPGDVYRFYADLKEIINSAKSQIMIVDPYFDGVAFKDYLSTINCDINIQILANRYSKDINSYVSKHQDQYSTDIYIRKSKELHDRIIFIDDDIAWIIGGSIKDAGKKATYLIPLQPSLSVKKKEIYAEIWQRAQPVEADA